MTFKLKSGNKPGFKQMGSSPAKDMKTGSYKQSFESPAKQIQHEDAIKDKAKPDKAKDRAKKNFEDAVKEAQTKKPSKLTDMDKEVLKRVKNFEDFTRKPVGPRVKKEPQEGSSPAKQSYPSSAQTGPYGPKGTLDEVKRIAKKKAYKDFDKWHKKLDKTKSVISDTKPKHHHKVTKGPEAIRPPKKAIVETKAKTKMAKQVLKKGVKKGLGKLLTKAIPGVGWGLTAYEVGKTIPKIVKATQKGLKKRAKSGNVNIGRKI